MSNEQPEPMPANMKDAWAEPITLGARYNATTRRFESDEPFAVTVTPFVGTAHTFVAEQVSPGRWQTAVPVEWTTGDLVAVERLSGQWSPASVHRAAMVRAMLKALVWDPCRRPLIMSPNADALTTGIDWAAPTSESAIRAQIAEASHAPHRVDVQFEVDGHGSMIVRVFGARTEDEAAIEAAVQQETPMGCTARVEFLRLADAHW